LSTRVRIAELNKLLSEKQKRAKREAGKAETIEANPEHGSKGDFVKVSVTLPPQVYEIIMDEQKRRKVEGPKRRRAGEKAEPHGISAIIREAVVQYIGGKG